MGFLSRSLNSHLIIRYPLVRSNIRTERLVRSANLTGVAIGRGISIALGRLRAGRGKGSSITLAIHSLDPSYSVVVGG